MNLWFRYVGPEPTRMGSFPCDFNSLKEEETHRDIQKLLLGNNSADGQRAITCGITSLRLPLSQDLRQSVLSRSLQ